MLRQGDLRSLGTGWSHPAVKQPVEQSSPPGEEEAGVPEEADQEDGRRGARSQES